MAHSIPAHPILSPAVSTPPPSDVSRGADASNPLYYSIFSALPAAVVVLDGRGVVTHLNPRARKLLGDGVVGALWRVQIQRLFDTSRSGAGLSLYNGRRVSLSTQSLGVGQGQLVMLQDVTEIDRLQQRLSQGQRLEELGRMAANLAHQIRTPLATALLYVTQLNEPRLDSNRRGRFVNRSVAALRGLEQLITQMLLFVRGERGEMSQFSVAELMIELQQEISAQTQAGSDKGEIQWRLLDNSHGMEIYNSRPLLKSALSNLLMNAVEAQRSEGSGLITLSIDTRPQQVVFGISDQAGGIAPEQQRQLFSHQPSQKSGGTGLGLTVVKRIIDELGGVVDYHSTPGSGSRFSITLPTTTTTPSEAE